MQSNAKWYGDGGDDEHHMVSSAQMVVRFSNHVVDRQIYAFTFSDHKLNVNVLVSFYLFSEFPLYIPDLFFNQNNIFDVL